MFNFFKKRDKIIPLNKLSKKDKAAIGEYIHAYKTETLIKSEGEAVIKMFKKHGVKEADETPLEAHAIMFLIKGHIEREDRTSIMRDYYKGRL